MKLLNFFKQEDPEIAAKIKAATKVSMDIASREKTRALLSEYVKMRPIRAAEPTPVPSPLSTNGLSVFFMRHSMPAFAAVLVIAVGGGTAAAAEGALPGDILYPVKVHVNEEVQATLAVTPKAKADWEVARAERRLEEAATLALSGRLDDATRAELDTNLDAHVKSAGENRQQLEDGNDASDASEVRTNINAILIARENILDGKRAVKALARTETAAFTMSARAVSAEATTDTVSEDDEAGTKGNRKAAKARIEAAKKFLNRSSARLSGDAREQVETRLKEAAEAFSSGEVDVSEGNKVGASSHFDSALESATKIEAIVSVSTNTDDSTNLDTQNESSDSSGSGNIQLGL
ncbi:MAG: DUF5667 domain-containing protein [bacterium]|nr:DUF5667 domain-containing protein [bacterium]